jgi:raffinose/stachyose/melibiose transport system substrate-binding protein
VLFKFKNIFLAIVVVVYGIALIPPREETAASEVSAEAASRAKFTIRIAPGMYMPGRRPMDVGEKLHAFADVARAFEKKFPDTHIEFSEMPGSREWLVTQLMGEQAPDIININVEDVWQDTQKGWYVPLDGFLDAPNPFAAPGQPGSKAWWDLFKYQAISRGKAAPDGKMYCITLDMIETGIYYNKDIFRRAGVHPPRDWKEFLEIQEKLKRSGTIPMLVDQGSLADWGVDLVFDQYYRSIRDGIDLYVDPKRAAYMKGYLDWDEIAYLNQKGFFTKDDPRWRAVFATLKDWRKYFVRDLGSVDTERSFINQKGAMYWSSSLTVNKLKRDPEIDFDWGIFYLPPITRETNEFASGVNMCVIGGAATQLSVTNSAFNDTKNSETSEKLKRVVAFLQFLTTPKQTDRVVNEMVALLPNVVDVPVAPALQPFDEILKRDYTTTKWLFTFDLRFREIMTRSFFLYLQGGMSLDELMDWMDKDVRSASETIVNRMHLDLHKFDDAWNAKSKLRAAAEGLPPGATP